MATLNRNVGKCSPTWSIWVIANINTSCLFEPKNWFKCFFSGCPAFSKKDEIRASEVFDQEYGSRKRITLWMCFLFKILQDHQSPKHQVVNIISWVSNYKPTNSIQSFHAELHQHLRLQSLQPTSRSPRPQTKTSRGPSPFPFPGSLFFGDANSGGEALFDVMGSLVSFHVNEINLSWILRQGSMPTIWQWESLREESVLGLCPVTKGFRESIRIMRVQHELKISLKIDMFCFSHFWCLVNLGCFGFMWGYQTRLLCCRFHSYTWSLVSCHKLRCPAFTSNLKQKSWCFFCHFPSCLLLDLYGCFQK